MIFPGVLSLFLIDLLRKINGKERFQWISEASIKLFCYHIFATREVRTVASAWIAY